MKKCLVIIFVECIRTKKLINVLNKLTDMYEIFYIVRFIKNNKKFTKKIKNYFQDFNKLIICGSCKYELNNKYVGRLLKNGGR